MGRFGGPVGLGERHDALGDGRSQRLDARRPRLVAQETLITFCMKRSCQGQTRVFDLPGQRMISLLPTPSALNRTISSPPNMLVWGVAIPREHLQTAAICGFKSDGNSGSHAQDSHASGPLGIPSGIQMSDAIH